MAWAPPAPPALSPLGTVRPRRRRPVLLAFGVACLILAVVLGLIGASKLSASRGPAATARAYFKAVASGHAADALAFANQPPTGVGAEYLTAKVLDQQLKIAPLRQLRVTATRQQGSQAVVDVQYLLGFADGPQEVEDTVALVRRGSGWRLVEPAASTQLVAADGTGERLTLMGRPLPSDTVQLFPGAVPIASDTAAVVVSDDPAVTLANLHRQTEVGVEVSGPTRTQVLAGLTSALKGCLAASSTDPRCPIVPSDRPVPGSMHGTLVRPLNPSSARIVLALSGDGVLSITAAADVSVRWQVWDFNNVAVSRQQTVTLTLNALASVDRPQTTYWDANA
jgi:hypothetical protein